MNLNIRKKLKNEEINLQVLRELFINNIQNSSFIGLTITNYYLVPNYPNYILYTILEIVYSHSLSNYKTFLKKKKYFSILPFFLIVLPQNTI